MNIAGANYFNCFKSALFVSQDSDPIEESLGGLVWEMDLLFLQKCAWHLDEVVPDYVKWQEDPTPQEGSIDAAWVQG